MTGGGCVRASVVRGEGVTGELLLWDRYRNGRYQGVTRTVAREYGSKGGGGEL